MAKQVIGIGAAPNDGSGDKLRIGADKINDNFTELYDFETANAATRTEFDNSFRCAINVAVVTGENIIAFSSAFSDANYLLEIKDPYNLVTSLDANDADGFTITASAPGVIHYIANYVK